MPTADCLSVYSLRSCFPFLSPVSSHRIFAFRIYAFTISTSSGVFSSLFAIFSISLASFVSSDYFSPFVVYIIHQFSCIVNMELYTKFCVCFCVFCTLDSVYILWYNNYKFDWRSHAARQDARKRRRGLIPPFFFAVSAFIFHLILSFQNTTILYIYIAI